MKRKAWRWTSTPLSADRGDISILAIVETIAAISISLGIAWHYRTVTHIAVSACLAPLLLLRTKRSISLGHVFAQRYWSWNIGNYKGSKELILLFSLLVSVAYLTTGIVATIVAVFNRPIHAINQIPQNWKRVVLATDSLCPPEVLPGYARRKKFPSIQYFGKQLSLEFSNRSISRNISIVIFACVLFIPSLVYRWSLKNTALIWSPLLWVIASARTTGPVRFRIDNICNLAMYKVMRLYSVIVLAAFAWKMTVVLGPKAVVLNTELSQFVDPYLVPAKLPLWQVGAAVSAVLAWILYFVADWHHRAIEKNNPNRSSDRSIKAQIAVITVIRNTLALYTIACTLYITGQISAGIKWPAVEFILFPWT